MKPRLTDAEFVELRKKRDESINEQVARVCAEQDWDVDKTHVHVSGASGCYCACPDGPCQHLWDGPVETGTNYESVTCSRCGTSAMSHDMRCGP